MRAVSRRRSEAQRPRAESTPPARGQRIRSIPSSAAIAAACIGPAPPKGSSAKPRGSMPRSTVTTRSARTISWLATRTIPAAVSSGSSPSAAASAPTAARGRVGVERDAAGEARVGGEVAEQQVGVGHRRLGAAAAVTGGPGLGAGRARADPQRAAGVAPADRAAAGADRVDVDHRQLDRCGRRSGASRCAARSPSSTTQTSQEVPPMSKPRALPSPLSAGEQAGPDGAAGRTGEDAPGAGPGRLRAPGRRRRRTASPAARAGRPPRAAAPSRPR